MASDLGLQHPDTVTMLAVRQFSQSKKYRKIKSCKIRRCTCSKSLLRAIRDPFTGSNTTKTPNILSGYGSVAVPQKILQRLGLQLRKVLGPYVEECFKLIIQKRFYNIFFHSIYQYK